MDDNMYQLNSNQIDLTDAKSITYCFLTEKHENKSHGMEDLSHLNNKFAQCNFQSSYTVMTDILEDYIQK